MANVVVVGSQWGDEGKGKIVDWLSEQADIVVRFQGGHNAGHTLVIDGVTYKLSLLPSGVVRGGKLSVIGNGVVVDPQALLDEIAQLEKQGVDGDARKSAHRRERRPDPAAASASSMPCARARNSGDPHRHHQARHRPGLRGQGRPPRHPLHGSRRPAGARGQDRAAAGASQRAAPRPRPRRNRRRRPIYDDLAALAPKVLPYMDSVWSLLDAKRREGKRILFEGAQGALLDIDHGTYPYVTSSNTVAAQAATGSGVGPNAIDYVLGICKAYTTRVGEGPFPTEQMDNAIGKTLGERGREFGTVTGRARRCGWFDAVLVRQTVRTCGIDGLALTKLDILDGFDEIKVCVRLSSRRPRNRLSSRRRARAGAGRAGLRDHRRLEGADRARALLGAIAGAGDQICAPHRGTGRLPGGAAVDQPGARGHHPDEESVRGMIPRREAGVEAEHDPETWGPVCGKIMLRKRYQWLTIIR